jgi:hypothetical protein
MGLFNTFRYLNQSLVSLCILALLAIVGRMWPIMVGHLQITNWENELVALRGPVASSHLALCGAGAIAA